MLHWHKNNGLHGGSFNIDNDSRSNRSRARFALLLAAICTAALIHPLAVAAAGNEKARTVSASADSSISLADDSSIRKSAVSAAVPQSLLHFTEDTVEQLSAHVPFTAWSEAELEYTPLGPGTHGWLVTVTDEGLPQGYLIISASEDGGYVLSEYGIGGTLPFSLGPLEQRLAAEGLFDPEGSLPHGSTIRKRYTGAPVWEVTLPGQDTLYISGFDSELLPSGLPASGTSDRSGIVVAAGSVNGWSADAPSITDNRPDPYDNLQWLTSSSLTARSSSELRSLLQKHPSLVFKSKGDGNAAFGAPFSLTGWQRWSSGSGSAADAAAIYVAIPLRNTDTTRFLPAPRLVGQGQFYAYPGTSV